MLQNQKDVDFVERDYGYVAYLRKAIDNSRDLSVKEMMTQQTMFHEGRRDYFTVSLRQINHLIVLYCIYLGAPTRIRTHKVDD